MWVRSQDKRKLCKVNCCAITQFSNGSLDIWTTKDNQYIRLGQYSTEEKALKVLDQLQQKVALAELLKTLPEGHVSSSLAFVYEMPQESEV